MLEDYLKIIYLKIWGVFRIKFPILHIVNPITLHEKIIKSKYPKFQRSKKFKEFDKFIKNIATQIGLLTRITPQFDFFKKILYNIFVS